ETSARAVGWKAMMRALSDFAAMSGLPEFALITLAIAGKKKASWVDELYRGLNRAAARFDVAIVGGETSETVGPTVIVVSVAGGVERERRVLRSGGKANDDLFVTAEVGCSIRGAHLNIGWFDSGATSEFFSTDRRSALVDCKFQSARHDGSERWSWHRSAAIGGREQTWFCH